MLARIFTTRYRPDPSARGFLDRAQKQESPLAEVALAVPDPEEATRIFGVPVTRKGVQPLHLRIANRSKTPLRLQALGIDPSYFTPLQTTFVGTLVVVVALTFWIAGLLIARKIIKVDI